MNFDWTKPLVIDWSGYSPLIKEDDIKNSVIKRILHNQLNPPFCEREYIPVKPWWDPQDPFGSRSGNSNNKHIRFIPGLRALPAYPQQSTLTKEQHLQGLKVLSTRFQFVQPKNYSEPTQEDIDAFEEFQAIYEAEQKEYHKWAKLLWLNGNCLRALRPKPALERVYEAEFRMRAHEVLSMPQQYSLAAQIPLQKDGACEMELQEELVNVDIQDLPEVDYPEEMRSDFSVLMKSCPVPEPCKVHPCKFVLPNEETTSVLPLSEIHCELAHYAANNDSTFVASENALQCLLDMDRSWKIPISVVEVDCPEYGDFKSIVVIGSEFNVQKACSTQRAYRAYKHLLRHTFAPSMGQYKPKSTAKQNTAKKVDKSLPVGKESSAPRSNRFVSLDDDLDVSSDEDDSEKLLIADGEKKNEPNLLDPSEPNKELGFRINENKEHEENDDLCINIDEPSNEPDQLLIDSSSNIDTIPRNSLEHNEPENMNDSSDKPNEPDQLMINKPCDMNKEPSNFIEVNEVNNTSCEPDQIMVEEPSNSSQLSDYSLDFYLPNKDSNYSHNEPFQLMNNNRPESTCGLDFYQPDYNITTRPNYSRDSDDPSSEPDKLIMNTTSKANEEVVDKYEKENFEVRRNCDKNKQSNELRKVPYASDSFNEYNSKRNSILDLYEDDRDNGQNNDELGEPMRINDKRNSENLDVMNKPTKYNSLEKHEDNVSLGLKQNTVKCENQSYPAKASSPIKCRISVRNLGLPQSEAFNLAALLNNPNTDTPEKDNSEIINDDVSIINGDPEKFTEGPARLGISGIITRNRSSVSASKPIVTSNAVVEYQEKVDIHHRISTRNYVSDVNKQNEKDVEIMKRSNISSKIAKIDDHVISSEATKLVIAGNRLNGTDNESLKTCGNVNKSFTSPTKNSSTKNIITRNRKKSNVDRDKSVEINELNAKNPQQNQNKGKVNESGSKKSPVKPCSVSVEPINVEPYVRKRISMSSLIECDLINKLDNNNIGGSKVSNKIDETSRNNAKTPTRKRNIEIDTEDSKIEPQNRYINVKTYARTSDPNKFAKPYVNKNAPINTEDNFSFKESNQPRNKRIKKDSKQVFLDHKHSQYDEDLNTKRQESVTNIDHDYCNNKDQTCVDEETATNLLFVDCQPAVEVYIRKCDNFEAIPNTIIPYETSNDRTKPCNSKTASRKVSLSGLFGVESDSDESTASFKADNREEQLLNSRKLSFSDPIDEPITVNSSLQECLNNNNTDSSRIGKRKLSFSDPENISDPDSEDAIAGFNNGVAVPRIALQKKQNTVNRSYGLRSKNKMIQVKTTVKSKSKNCDRSTKKGRFTKISPINTRKRNACSNSENDSDEQNISLRRSKRITNVDNFEDISQALNKRNANESAENTKKQKRSGHFSDHLSSKGKQLKTIHSKNILTKPVKKLPKIVKTRRKSLPSNTFSERAQRKPMLRSKSLSNINEITESRRTRPMSESVSCITRSKTTKCSNKKIDDCLKLSQRTKRYLRRILNVDGSESDESVDEMSQSTERNVHSSLSSDNERITKPCTRLSIASSKGTTKTNKSRNKDYLDTSKRYSLRSSAANSSCDDIEKSNRVRKTKTHEELDDHSANATAQTNVKMNLELLETVEPKNESNCSTEILEKYKIEIDITEETNSVKDETLQALHFIELSNSCEENATQSDIQIADIEFDDRRSNKTIARIDTKESIKQQTQASATALIASKKVSKHDTVDVDSESFDFFNMCVNDEFNILHFTATNETDSEDETLTIDDPQSQSNATKLDTKNAKICNIEPKKAQTESSNVFGESSKKVVQASTSNKSIKPQSKGRGRKEQPGLGLNCQNTKSKDVSDNKETNCTCKGTLFETPPPRSFKKWRVRNRVSHVGFNVIVHSSHRVRTGDREVLLEPVVEYQPELGASKLGRSRLRAYQLALMLRDDAALLNVRIDHSNGNVIVVEPVTAEQVFQAADARTAVADIVFTALDQLRFLMPGQYVLAHDPSHGPNAMLYTSKGVHNSATSLSLQQANINMPDAEDALFAKIYPELDLALLPYHKHRGILPLAFTPLKLVKEDKKMAAALARAKPPPSAIQWPKKKKKSKKRVIRQPQE